MNEKKYITAAENAQKDNIPEDCRYTYFARTVLVDGTRVHGKSKAVCGDAETDTRIAPSLHPQD